MSEAALDMLSTRIGALRQALDTQDAETIEHAVAAAMPAIDAVRAQGAWRSDDRLRASLVALIRQLDASRVISNVMGDLTRRQLDLLSGGAVAYAPTGYSRHG